MSTVGQISNGESGCSVRTKLNAVIDEVNVTKKTAYNKDFGSTAGTVMEGFTNYTQSFAYTDSPFTLTVAPNYIYSIRTTSMVLDESDVNDVIISGTTLTVINPAFQAGETLYIKYKG